MRLEAELLITTGEAAQAEQQYRKILELRAVPWAKLGLAKSLYAQKRLPECDQDSRRLGAGERSIHRCLRASGKGTREPGNSKPPATSSHEPTAFHPTGSAGHASSANSALELGDARQAEVHFHEVVRLAKYPDFRNPEDNVQLAATQLAQRKLADAESTVRDLERSMMGLPGSRACLELANAMLLGQKVRATRLRRLALAFGWTGGVSRPAQEASATLAWRTTRRQGVAKLR